MVNQTNPVRHSQPVPHSQPCPGTTCCDLNDLLAVCAEGSKLQPDSSQSQQQLVCNVYWAATASCAISTLLMLLSKSDMPVSVSVSAIAPLDNHRLAPSIPEPDGVAGSPRLLWYVRVGTRPKQVGCAEYWLLLAR